MVKGPPGRKRKDILPSATHSQRSPSPLPLEPWLEPRCESLKEPLRRAAGKQMTGWGPGRSAWLCALRSSDPLGLHPSTPGIGLLPPLKDFRRQRKELGWLPWQLFSPQLPPSPFPTLRPCSELERNGERQALGPAGL